MGAALSFYMVFSLAPLVVVTLSLVSLAVARNTASAAMIDQVRALVGNSRTCRCLGTRQFGPIAVDDRHSVCTDLSDGA